MMHIKGHNSSQHSVPRSDLCAILNYITRSSTLHSRPPGNKNYVMYSVRYISRKN